jgi:hypothetical protein
MLSRRVVAQAVIAAAALTSTFAFILHAPCRGSSYVGDRFTSMCYTDSAALFANPPLLNGAWPFGGTDAVMSAPLPTFFMWLLSQTSVNFISHVLMYQLVLTAFFMWTAISTMKYRGWRPMDAALLALSPLWPLIMFVSDEMISVGFAAAALLAWQQRRFPVAGLLLGLGLASGGWVWVLGLAMFVVAYRDERVRDSLTVIGIATLTALITNIPRVLSGDSLFQPWQGLATEGTPTFIFTLIQGIPSVDTTVIAISGFLVVLATARWAIATPFDFRIEVLILIFAVMQILSSPAISPQNLVPYLWLAVLVFPSRVAMLWISVPLMVYVGAVWLRFESLVPDAVGIHPSLYAVAAIVMWFVLGISAWRAFRLIRIQGSDKVNIAAATHARKSLVQA